MTRTILLIDDDRQVVDLLDRFFRREDWLVLRAGTAETAFDLFETERPDLVLLDLNLPGMGGLDLLAILRQKDPHSAVLMLTGHGDISTAVEAMHLGAENFLAKPVELNHLKAVVERAYEKVMLRRQNELLAERQDDKPALDMLGQTPAMREIARQVERMAPTATTILVQGETGTGKTWVARLIHGLSPRASKPFVEINCGGLTATFLDSELFGHERGAFTDAKQQKRGLFEVADGGTLFLDEIGDLAPELQPKLLKVLETHKFRRLGGTREIAVDVRLIAATNRPLAEDVKTGKFREDLYYRLNVFPLHLPPLRERAAADLASLAYELLRDLRRRMGGRGPDRISDEALAMLSRHAWPGNIREFRNVLERALIMASGAQEVEAAHLPAEVGGAALPRPLHGVDPRLTLEEVERRHVSNVLEFCKGNRTQAARSLGISRRSLYDKLHRYGLI